MQQRIGAQGGRRGQPEIAQQQIAGRDPELGHHIHIGRDQPVQGALVPRAITTPNSVMATTHRPHEQQATGAGPHPQAGQGQGDQPDEAHVLAEQHIAVVGQQGVERQPGRQLVLLIKARRGPPPLALQQQVGSNCRANNPTRHTIAPPSRSAAVTARRGQARRPAPKLQARP